MRDSTAPWTVRVYGAVMTEDGPVAEIREVTSQATYDAARADAAFRAWGWCDVTALVHDVGRAGVGGEGHPG